MFGNLKDINDKGVIIMKNNFDTNELSVLTEVCNILKKHKKNAIDAPSTLDINKLAQDLLEEIIKGNGDKKYLFHQMMKGILIIDFSILLIQALNILKKLERIIHVWKILIMNR